MCAYVCVCVRACACVCVCVCACAVCVCVVCVSKREGGIRVHGGAMLKTFIEAINYNN